jgi:peptidyl-prolyl cis-trans isomerase D
MSVLEKIRSRAGLLVGIIGVALLVFILQSALESGNFFFGNSDTTVGEIAGKSIDYTTFNAKVQESIENQKRNTGQSSLDQAATDNIIQQVWNQFINEEVMQKEYEKLGITVSDEELYHFMVEEPHPALVRNLSDPQTGQVAPMFADEKTGMLSSEKIRQFTQSMTPEQETQWLQLEDFIRQTRVIEKYNNLIKKGLYVTTAVSKRDYIAQNTNANIKYVIKNYKTVADSTIKVTDEELNTYYNAHQNEYKQEAARKIEYVAFDIAPSQEDFNEVEKYMQQVAADFKTKKAGEDSAFVVAESDSRFVDQAFNGPGALSPLIDTAMFKAEVGTVMGPFRENDGFVIAKLIATKNAADSAKVRHLLIAYQGSGASQTVTRTKDQAKKMADSLLVVLKKERNKFADLVEKLSDDGGKTMPPNKKEGEDYMGKGGNYGWINAKSGFVEPFKNAGLDNKKGDLVIAESNFGYHIMEVLDSKGSQKKIQTFTINKLVEPSSKTAQEIFTKANTFANANKTNEAFQKSVIDQKLNKRIAENIKENDKNIAGLDSPRALIKWAYENKNGTVSEPLEFGDKYVVAVITEVKEKGIAPLEQVKEDITAKVVREKKIEMFTKEFASAGSTIDAIASKMQLNIEQAQNVNFNTSAIPGSANEPAVIGAISVQKASTLSKPIGGKEGVFVVYVETVTPAQPQADYKAQQQAQTSQMQPRVDYEVYDALKENANITEHLVKFY